MADCVDSVVYCSVECMLEGITKTQRIDASRSGLFCTYIHQPSDQQSGPQRIDSVKSTMFTDQVTYTQPDLTFYILAQMCDVARGVRDLLMRDVRVEKRR